MQVLVYTGTVLSDEPSIEVEVNYTCETPEMAMLVLYSK